MLGIPAGEGETGLRIAPSDGETRPALPVGDAETTLGAGPASDRGVHAGTYRNGPDDLTMAAPASSPAFTGTTPAALRAGTLTRTGCSCRASSSAATHHQAAWRRRHGRGLPGVGRGARRRGRAQGHQAGGRARSGRGAGIERRFKRELLLARQVTHKNVVRIHDLGEIDGIKYITMPYVDGARPGDVLQERRQAAGAERALRIVRGVVSGLPPRTRRASCTAI